MRTIALGAIAATLVASAATAAPLRPTESGAAEVAGIDQVRLICNEYGHCYRTRGRRYVQPYYDDDAYVVRRGYRHYGGPGYYDRGSGYYGGGPGIGFSFGSRGW